MKVLVNAISAKKGGIVTYTTNLIEALRTRGIDAMFALPEDLADQFPENGMAETASNFSPIMRLIWEQTIWRRRIRSFAPDVLFSSANFGLFRSPVPQVLLLREGGLFDPMYLYNIAPAQGAKVAVTRHLRRRLILMSARYADHVLSPSAAMRDMLLPWAPDVAAKCSVNLYGTLPSLYHPAAAPRPWRADGTLRLIFVSAYYPHKNPAILCEAVDRLRAEGQAAHATITMDIDEVQMPGSTLDRLLMQRSAANDCVSLGHCDYRDLPALYHAHDVFVFPSVSESFGHPMVEALATGLPIVAADTAINREICGEAALYFHPFLSSDLTQCLHQLDADPALRNRLRKAAIARAQKLYDWDAHVDRLVTTFESVANRRRRRNLISATAE